MDVEEHLEGSPVGYFFLEVRPDELNLSQTDFEALGVVISKKEAIHVFALCVAAVVASNDTVGVDNRSNPKLKVFSHLVADYFAGHQKVDESVDDEGRVGLAAVLSSDDENDRLLLSGRSTTVAALGLVCDLDERYVKVAVGAAQRFESHEFVVCNRKKKVVKSADDVGVIMIQRWALHWLTAIAKVNFLGKISKAAAE